MRKLGTLSFVCLLGCAVAGMAAEDIDALRARAEAGTAAAQFEFGLAYAHGTSVPQDYDAALKWYRLAAAQNFAAAEFSVANAYFAGVIVPPDLDAGVEWLRRAARHGDAQAQTNLGLLMEHGNGLPQDPAEAARWYRRAADQGDLDGQLFLGGLYAHGKGVARSQADALKWWLRTAQQGDADSQYGVALIYWNGEGTHADPVEALKWFRLAAAQGSGQAHLRVGQFYARGEGVARDAGQAWFHFQLAADSPDRWQQMLADNESVRDLLQHVEAELTPVQKAEIQARLPAQRASEAQLALTLLMRRAREGDPKSQYLLGFNFYLGDGVSPDESAAIGWWRASAEQGYQDSMARLGFHLWEADAPLRNRSQALQWLERASDLGSNEASRYVGRLYWLGRDVAEDDKRAYAFTARCGTGDDGDCISQLALFTHLGVGTEKDDEKSRDLYEKSAALGSNAARCELGQLLDWKGEDLSRSERLILEAAAGGEAECQRRAGQIAAGANDTKAAFAWFEKSAAQGNRQAQVTVVNMLLNTPQVRDVERALRETEVCWKRTITTCANIAGIYFIEYAQPRDVVRGKQFLLRAHAAGDRYATKILGEFTYFSDSASDEEARRFLQPLADDDSEAARWLARLDAREGHASEARARLLKLRAKEGRIADWLLSRACAGAGDCPKDAPTADAIVAKTKSELAHAKGDDMESAQWSAWRIVEQLGADPHSDRRDGEFALRVAALLPLNSGDAQAQATNLETLATAQARAGKSASACASEKQALTLLENSAHEQWRGDPLRLSRARRDAYCAGRTWNQPVRQLGHLIAHNVEG